MLSNPELDAQVLEIDRKRAFRLFRELQGSSRKEWLVRKMLGAGEASAIYGKPGDGKSVLVQDMAMHIAAGWDWFGRPVRQGAVLYVALERRMLVERRAIAFRIKHRIADLPFAVAGGVYDFRNPSTANQIADMCRAVEQETGEELVLVVVDTLSRALAGGDENSPKDMGAIVNATGVLLSRTRAHVAWIHHTPLDAGDRMRGHGALLGAVDTTINVARSGSARTGTVVKANDSEEGEAVSFALESVVIGTDEEGDTTAPVVVPQEHSGARQSTPTRKLSDKQRLALASLTETVLSSGKPAPASYQLPQGVKIVDAETWREEMFRRGVLERDHPNPRQEFKRIRDALAARQLIGVREEFVWGGVP